MQRVIGLDIGSYSIKAVEIVNTLKSYEIVNFYENVIPHLDEVSMDAVAPGCMEQLFKENNLEADRIVTAMPGQFISSRLETFNYSDPRKIEKSIYAVVEDVVPFHMDDMILDHQSLGTINNKTVALAVMTRKAFLKNFLDLLQRINIDPKLVDVDSLAFYNLSSFMNVDPSECFGMIDIGHEKTSMCVVREGVLRLFRSINLGGRYITEFLARDLETSFQEAQRVKHRVSRVLCHDDPAQDLSPEDYMVVERMTLAANAIIKELGRTLYAFKSWEKDPLSRLFLSGGASRTKNLGKLIEDQLEVRTVSCRLDETELKFSNHLAEHMTIMPQSVAIGMRTVSSLKKHSQINLRKGEFAYVQNYEHLLAGIMSGAKIAAIALVLLTFSYCVKWWFYQGQIDSVRDQYRKEYIAMFRDQARKYPPSVPFAKLKYDAEKKLKGSVGDYGAAIAQFQAENSGSGALIVLKELSEVLPKDVPVDVTLFDFKRLDSGDSKLVLKAETEGYALQSKVVDAIKTAPSLIDVVEKNTSVVPGTENKIVEVTVEATYKGQDRG